MATTRSIAVFFFLSLVVLSCPPPVRAEVFSANPCAPMVQETSYNDSTGVGRAVVADPTDPGWIGYGAYQLRSGSRGNRVLAARTAQQRAIELATANFRTKYCRS